MIRAFQTNKRNERPCLKCNAIDHGLTMHKAYIRQPCRCCGANDHCMLGCLTDDEGNTTTIPTCPLIEFDNRNLTEQLSKNFLRYRASEEKFAALHGYNIDRVSTALEAFEKHGDGSFMIPYYRNLYKQNVIRLCEETRATWTWTFKRVPIEVDSDEESLEL